MKALSKFLTVCLIALVMLSPGLVVWRIWHYHNAFVDAQRTVLLNPAVPDRTFIQDRATSTPTVKSSFQSASPTTDTPAFIGFIVSILVGFYSGRLLNHYQARRSNTLRQQIAILERIWQQSIY